MYTSEQKSEAIKQLAAGVKVPEVSKTTGVPKSTIYTWKTNLAKLESQPAENARVEYLQFKVDALIAETKQRQEENQQQMQQVLQRLTALENPTPQSAKSKLGAGWLQQQRRDQEAQEYY